MNGDGIAKVIKALKVRRRELIEGEIMTYPDGSTSEKGKFEYHIQWGAVIFWSIVSHSYISYTSNGGSLLRDLIASERFHSLMNGIAGIFGFKLF